HASLMLKVSDGSTTQTVTDASNSGSVSFTGAIGSFIFNMVTGLSTPLIGSINLPALDMSLVDVSSHSTRGTLTFSLTDTGFMGGGGSDGILHFLSAIGGTINGGGSVSVDAYMDCSNAAFGTSTHLGSQSYGGVPYSGSKDAYVSACAGPYSVTEL